MCFQDFSIDDGRESASRGFRFAFGGRQFFRWFES